MPSQTARVLTFEDARRTVETEAERILHSRKREAERVPLLASAGRVLAEQVVADRDIPPFPRATRDGFAVRVADIAAASENAAVELRRIGEIAAGAPNPLPTLSVGEAIGIMTGAPVPPGADAVVMVEYTRCQDGNVLIQRAAKQGENIVPTGSEARGGAVLLRPGRRMYHAAIAVAASVGRSDLAVYKPPRVAVLSTGDEIVEITTKPGDHQIRNSNSYSLAAQVQAAGGEAAQLSIARDEINCLRELVHQGLQYDLLLLSGGVSMGKYDLVEPVLQEFGAEFFFTGALIQPGRPVVFGCANAATKRQTYFFGLPGNPVSTLVTFELFARPILDALSGADLEPQTFLRAKLKTEICTKTGLTRFLPARLSGEYAKTEVELVKWQGSGDVVATAQANCYIVVPPDRDRIPPGELVPVLLR